MVAEDPWLTRATSCWAASGRRWRTARARPRCAATTSWPARWADVPALFASRVADYRAVVHRVAEALLPARIEESLRVRGARKLVAPVDLPGWWRVGEVVWSLDAPAHPLPRATLDRSDGVLTGCAVAIAETGTIVLDAGEAQGRRALTLLPDYHLCVVHESQIVGTVPEALARLDPRAR